MKLSQFFISRPIFAGVLSALIFLAVGLVYPALVTILTYEANFLMGPGVAGALGNLAPLFAVGGAVLIFG